MFFLIKCAFWLGILFSCMNWPGGERPEAVAREAASAVAVHARAAVVEKASAICAGSPVECLGALNRATSLAQAPAATKKPERTKSVH